MSTPPTRPSGRGFPLLGCLVGVAGVAIIIGAIVWGGGRVAEQRRAADPLIGQIRTVKAGCAVSVRRRDGASGYDEAARVEPSASVRVTDHHEVGLTVEIVDGAYKGRVGWLATVCLGL